MYPGKPGDSRRDFVGLDEPPALPPDTRGRSFTLYTYDLGSLTRGSPISYRGVTVGEVEDYVSGRTEGDFVTYLNAKCGTHRVPGGGLTDSVRFPQLFFLKKTILRCFA